MGNYVTYSAFWQQVLLSVSQIESNVKASMLALKTRFLAVKCSHFRAKSEFVSFLKTTQQLKKGSGCATQKEDINRIPAVDEEHFFGFLSKVLSIWDTGM